MGSMHFPTVTLVVSLLFTPVLAASTVVQSNNDKNPIISPTRTEIVNLAHKNEFRNVVGYPPQTPQKATEQLTSSGDRNPKNLIVHSGCLWFSQAINHEGQSAVQWHIAMPMIPKEN